nr:HEAT repeat-containing protein 6 isoform X1 [Onthophagus taurus]XP_022905161.1 HEAT repeat-containing protein 6 isoform X1 [Onthophagus taurus]XP_022905163.1 HEAT repeat-containing protein 6 isoform X1 [Onthophagus taurus]XP_022905164.1 HEAT repeat-containing protein 6 isoform X1 [Onthophagus taurus]
MANIPMNIFDDLLSQLTNLTYRRTQGDVKLIEKTIDELNNMEFSYFLIPPHKTTLLVNQCCTLIQPDNESLVSKCCKLIQNFIKKHDVIIEGKTCSILISWCLEALRQNKKDCVIIDVLITLEMVLKANGDNVHDYTQDIINKNSVIMKLTENKNNPQRLILAVECLEASTAYSKDMKRIKRGFESCLTIFNNYLANNIEFDEPYRSKLLISCLGGLQNIINHDVNYLKSEIGSILGIVRSYMLYGVKDVQFIAPQKLLPSVSSIPDPAGLIERRGGHLAKQRKHKNTVWKKGQQNKSDIDLNDKSNPSNFMLNEKQETRNKFTSDSEMSEVESNVSSKLVQFQTKVRLRSLNIFYDTILSIDRRTLFLYSVNFIPDGWPAGTHSLTSIILRDPSRTCRTAALHVLQAMLVELKTFLLQAERNDKNTPFTTYSVTLGSIVVELHRTLRLALNDVSANVQRQVLKCFAALVQATPYHRLRPGLLTRNVRSLKRFLTCKDPPIKTLTLIVFGCMISSYPVLSEAINVFSKNSIVADSYTDNSESSIQSSSTFQDVEIDYAGFSSDEDETNEEEVKNVGLRIPWLVQYCLGNLGVIVDENGECVEEQSGVIVTEKVESLKIFTVMSNNYFTTFITPYLNYILKALELSLESKITDVILHAGRAIHFIGYGISEYLANNANKTHITIEQGLFFWNSLLSGPFSHLIEFESESHRAVACQCLENIGKHIFECLSKTKQMLIMMTLLASSKETGIYITTTALRALSVCISYPSLRGDIGFLIDTIEVVIKATENENVGVHVSAYWAFGNVSDALIENETDQIYQIEPLPKSIWIKLFECGIKGACGHYKNKSYAVRALGNFIFIRNDMDVDEDYKVLVKKSIECIVDCAKKGENAKVKWNACYGLGKLVKNKTLHSDNTWQESVFQVLLDLVVDYKNFKVRINAASALSSFTTRQNYGDFYGKTWKKLLEALENSERMDDFTEYKHRDHLVDQICLSIGNLCSMMEKTDLPMLIDCINFYEDLLRINIQKVYLRLIPEKSQQLLLAEEHLRKLSTSPTLTKDEINVLERLIKIINNDVFKE